VPAKGAKMLATAFLLKRCCIFCFLLFFKESQMMKQQVGLLAID
jgi:hypothetical protein